MNDEDLFYEEREPEPEKKEEPELQNGYGYQEQGAGQNQGMYVPQPVNGFAVGSLITGIISTLCCLCPYASLPCAIAAVVTAILSKRNGKRPAMSYVGLVLGIIGLVISVMILAYAFYIASNPELMQQLMEQYEKLLQESMS